MTTKNLSPTREWIGFISIFVFLLIPSNHSLAQTCIFPPQDLVAWWPGEGNGNDIIDGNQGNLVGGASFGVGKVGQAFTFTDNTQTPGTVDVADVVGGASVSLPLGDNPRTVEAWIKTSKSGGIIFHYGILGSGVATNYHLFVGGVHGGTSGDATVGNGAGFGVVEGGGNVVDNVFHHLAGVTNSDGSTEIYVDGVLLNAGFITPPNTLAGSFTIGAALNRDSGGDWVGSIDEVSVYNRALTASEIQAIFNAGSAGKCKAVLSCEASDAVGRIDEAVIEINGLGLDFGTAQTLVQKLEEAKDKISLDDLHDARSKVSVFVGEIETAVNNGALPIADANVLLNRASCILAAIQFP